MNLTDSQTPPSRKCRHFNLSEGVGADVCKRGVAYSTVRQLPATLDRAWLLPCVESDGIAYRCDLCGYEENTK